MNSSDKVVNLTGWKLVSEEGNQTFTFPSGTTLPAGGTLNSLYCKEENCRLIAKIKG